MTEYIVKEGVMSRVIAVFIAAIITATFVHYGYYSLAAFVAVAACGNIQTT